MQDDFLEGGFLGDDERNRDLRPPLRYNLIRNRIKPYPLKRKSTNMPLPRGRSTEPADSNDNRAEPDLHDIVDRPSLLRFTSLGRWGAYSAHITPRPGSALGQRTRMLAMEDQPPQHDDNNTGTFAQENTDSDASDNTPDGIDIQYFFDQHFAEEPENTTPPRTSSPSVSRHGREKRFDNARLGCENVAA
ncbi:unnamed protein product [Symbiodinium sp. KB8]|nr:unnamed protein product [Symbiodinium sp. KB8]